MATRTDVLTDETEVGFAGRLFRPYPEQARRLAEMGITPRIESAEHAFHLTVDEYHRAVDAGIFTSDDRIELLEGWLITRMSINPPHRIATRRTRVALERIVPAGWYVDQQNPITTLTSEPEPDISVIRGTTEDYPDRHPGPAEVALVVEVAASSLPADRKEMRRLYAGSGLVAYWIVNLVDRCVEVHTEPTGPSDQADYRNQSVFGPDDAVPFLLDGREVGRIAVREILP